MEAVDWNGPDSSAFCLACHRPVGPAMAGLDVRHGHPQNVRLSAAQLDAVADLGTVTGPGDTLICISCHKLGDDAAGRSMLAAPLTDGELCAHCHPGHYARGTPHDLRISAPQERNRRGETAAEGGPCSACHLAHRYARAFEPCPHDPDGRCTTCHALLHCAEAHARTTMDHPEARCLECHDPHDTSHPEFLRASNVELCTRCHEGYADGTAAGAHPVGRMDDPVPQALIDAGAAVHGDPHELTCMVCHQAHTADHAPLLVMEADSNRLCLSCHDDMRGEEAVAGVSPRHGQQPKLNAEQRAVVAGWGTRCGAQGELLCISCHQVHGSRSTVALLAFQPRYGETCSACHPDHDRLVGTSHDLRTNFPDQPNLAGMTPAEHGACSACHLAHGFAVETATPEDPIAQCLACHRQEGCAEAKRLEGMRHPDCVCTDCHNPHERRYGNFLAQREPQLCTECHQDYTRLSSGPHDVSSSPEAWPEWARTPGGLCLSCHIPHGGEHAGLHRRHGPDPVANHDDVCLACHQDAAWEAQSVIAAIHPYQIPADPQHHGSGPLTTDPAGNARIGCRTCHDPHGGRDPVHLARVAPGVPAEAVCLDCHVEQRLMRFTKHSAQNMKPAGLDTDSCRPCHAMHAPPGGSWGQMLSPRFLQSICDTLEPHGASCVPCLACHHEDGPAPLRAIDTHPEADLWNSIPPDAPGYLPLYDVAGHVDTEGQVTCRTCHVSHGRLDLLRRMEAEGDLTAAERSSMRSQVRPYVEPNLCTGCHGNEARFRFLFFHNPQRRSFPRTDPTSQRPSM
jgi:predicted CXXCH cytochrome family protein